MSVFEPRRRTPHTEKVPTIEGDESAEISGRAADKHRRLWTKKWKVKRALPSHSFKHASRWKEEMKVCMSLHRIQRHSILDHKTGGRTAPTFPGQGRRHVGGDRGGCEECVCMLGVWALGSKGGGGSQATECAHVWAVLRQVIVAGVRATERFL